MEIQRAEQVMQSLGVVNISYNGMPVWIEAIRGDMAKVSLVGTDQNIDVPVSALAEADPMQTM